MGTTCLSLSLFSLVRYKFSRCLLVCVCSIAWHFFCGGLTHSVCDWLVGRSLGAGGEVWYPSLWEGASSSGVSRGLSLE